MPRLFAVSNVLLASLMIAAVVRADDTGGSLKVFKDNPAVISVGSAGDDGMPGVGFEEKAAAQVAISSAGLVITSVATSTSPLTIGGFTTTCDFSGDRRDVVIWATNPTTGSVVWASRPVRYQSSPSLELHKTPPTLTSHGDTIYALFQARGPVHVGSASIPAAVGSVVFAFVAATGAVSWAKSFPFDGVDDVDEYSTSTCGGPHCVGGSTSDPLLSGCCYNSDPQYQFENPSMLAFSSSTPKGYASANSAGVFVSGIFTSTLSYGSGTLTSAGTQDTIGIIALAKADGTVTWAKAFGGANDDHIRRGLIATETKLFAFAKFKSASVTFSPLAATTFPGGENGGDLGNTLWAMSTTNGDADWAKPGFITSSPDWDVDGSGGVTSDGKDWQVDAGVLTIGSSLAHTENTLIISGSLITGSTNTHTAPMTFSFGAQAAAQRLQHISSATSMSFPRSTFVFAVDATTAESKWLKVVGGGNNFPTGMAASEGKIHLVGTTESGELTFSSTFVVSTAAVENKPDLFVCEMSAASGQVNWARAVGGDFNDHSDGIASGSGLVAVPLTFASSSVFVETVPALGSCGTTPAPATTVTIANPNPNSYHAALLVFEASGGCPPGFTGEYLACVACPVGKADTAAIRGWTTPADKGGCTTCAAASRANLPLAATSCPLCSSNEFQEVSGQASCKICPQGSVSAEGALACTACSAGQFRGNGSVSCQVCAADSYQDLTGQSSCRPCGAGMVSETKALACTPCPAGQSKSNGASCQICAADTFQDLSGQASCKICPQGTVSAEGALACTPCPVGQFKGNGSISCQICAADTYQDLSGQSLCRPCGAGMVSEMGALACSACSAGQYKNGLSCTKCPSLTTTTLAPMGLCQEGSVVLRPDFNGSVWWESNSSTAVSQDSSSLLLLSNSRNDSGNGSSRMYECPSTACLYAKDSSAAIGYSSWCAEGHEGKLCAVCKVGYYSSAEGCLKCAVVTEEGAGIAYGGMSAFVVVFFLGSCGVAFRCFSSDNEGKRDALDEQSGDASADAGDDGLDGATDGGTGQTKGRAMGQAGSLFGALKKAVGGKIVIGLSYFQVVSLFETNLAVPWPAELRVMFSIFSLVNIDVWKLGGFRCLAAGVTYYSKFQFFVFTPIFLGLFIGASCLIGRAFVAVPSASWDRWVARHTQIFYVTLFLIYPSVTTTILKMWRCMEVDGEMWLVADMQLPCTGPAYEFNLSLSIFFFVAIPIGVPLWTIWCLSSRVPLIFALVSEADVGESGVFVGGADGCIIRGQKIRLAVTHKDGPEIVEGEAYIVDSFDGDTSLATFGSLQLKNSVTVVSNNDDDTAIQNATLAFGWLAAPFEYQYWYWQLIEFGRKLILSVVVTFVRPGTSTQIVIGCVVCVVFLCLVGYKKPYADEKDDFMNSIAFMALALTLALGLGLRIQNMEVSSVVETFIFNWSLLLVNIGLILLAVFMTIQDTKDTLEERAAATKSIHERMQGAAKKVSAVRAIKDRGLLQKGPV